MKEADLEDLERYANELCDAAGYSPRYRKLLVAAVRVTGRPPRSIDNDVWEGGVSSAVAFERLRAFADPFTLRDHGSFVLIKPLTKACRAWLKKYTKAEKWQWQSGALVVDFRYVDDIVKPLREAMAER